jgi:surface carbohydrate biosynthesis protein
MGKQKIDLMIFIEHVARELDIATALKYHIINRYGLSVEIASIVAAHGRKEALKKFEPRVAALPFFYSTTKPGPQDILLTYPHVLCVNLAYEQIFSQINQVFKAPKDTYSKNNVLHHAWGDFFSRYLQDFGVVSENIFVNGNPSYALYQPPYAAFYPNKSELAQRYSIDANKRWVLIPENYGAAFYDSDRLKEYLKYGLQDAYNYRDFALASFREAIIWWQQAANLDGLELIVRPRPAVPGDVFIKTCVDLLGVIPEHLHIIKEGTVREWILSSDIVMSSYSTTLIEAAVASKPIYMLEPIPFPPYIQADWYGFVPRLQSQQEFLAVLCKSRLDDSYQQLHTWACESMLKPADVIGSLAHWLAAVCKGETHLPPAADATSLPARPQNKIQRAVKNPAGAVKSLWSMISRKSEEPEKVIGYEQDAFTSLDVAERVKRWGKILE